MAKRKHAAALFEVIHHGEKHATSRSDAWTIPSLSAWLRKGRKPAASDAPPKQAATRSASGPSLMSRLRGFLPSMPRIGMDLDPDRHVVSFKLSYTTALISAFVVLVVITLAFVVGKHATRRITPALADMTTDELRNGPAQPDVLDVGGDSAPLAMATTSVPEKRTPLATEGTPGKRSTPQPPAANAGGATMIAMPSSVKVDANREAGRQYVVMQCYPQQEKQMADDACQYLTKNGVPCTVEYNTFYAKDWFAVVGIAGFDHIRSAPEYDHYIATINQLSQKFGEKSRFKKLDPKPIKWRAVIKGVG